MVNNNQRSLRFYRPRRPPYSPIRVQRYHAVNFVDKYNLLAKHCLTLPEVVASPHGSFDELR